METSTFVLRGRCGTYGTGLALVARLGWDWSPVTPRHFASQAWHTIFHTPHCHPPSLTHHLSHTTLSHTIFDTPSFTHHLCHTPSFTHHLSHTVFGTPSFIHIFVNHHLSHTIFHTHLCQPPSLTHLCQPQYFTHNFVNHHLSHTTLSHTPSLTLNFVTHHLCHTPSFTHHFVTHHLWHTIVHTALSHTIFHTPLCHTPSFTHHL